MLHATVSEISSGLLGHLSRIQAVSFIPFLTCYNHRGLVNELQVISRDELFELQQNSVTAPLSLDDVRTLFDFDREREMARGETLLSFLDEAGSMGPGLVLVNDA